MFSPRVLTEEEELDWCSADVMGESSMGESSVCAGHWFTGAGGNVKDVSAKKVGPKYNPNFAGNRIYCNTVHIDIEGGAQCAQREVVVGELNDG